MQHVLLVRKIVWEDSYYRTGVERIPITATGWGKVRKLMLVWGDEELAGSIRQDGMRPNIAHGFRIQSPDKFAIVPIDLRIRPTWLKGSNNFPLCISPCASGFIWDFGDPIEPTFGTMTCRPEALREFSIYLTFDFDGHPCCLVFHDTPSDPWEWFRIIDASTTSQESDKAKVDQDMKPINDQTTGKTSWLFRTFSVDNFTRAKVPVAITGIYQFMWLWFCPSGLIDLSASWTFGLSLAEPRMVQNNYPAGERPQGVAPYSIVLGQET